jgi:hypothetical protein
MATMPEAYKEHFDAILTDKKGASKVRLEKIGELKTDAKHIVELTKESDVGDFLEAFGYFAARRLLKKGEAKQLYNKWLETKPADVKKPDDWQHWFAKSFTEWHLDRMPKPSGLVKLFDKVLNLMKAIYVRYQGYKTMQPEVESMFEDLATGARDIVTDKYFYSDKQVMDRFLFGTDPSPKDMATQGFSKNNKTHYSYDPGNICPKTEAFAQWLYSKFEKDEVQLADLTEQRVWVDLMAAARLEGIDTPCSYCYVEQNRRNAVILHNEGAAKTRVDYEKVKTMLTAIPYTDYLIKKNRKGE